MRIRMIFLILFALSAYPAYAQKCDLSGSEYVPQNQILEESFDPNRNVINRTLSFVMRAEEGNGNVERSVFLLFDAYKGQKKVSTMRLGNAWSNGVSRQSVSTYYGMYCNFNKDKGKNCEDMKPAAGFYPIGVREDLTGSAFNNAPELIIFPGSFWELRYKSYEHPEHWDKYIKFYTDDRIYPDWRGYDFWVRTKCGKSKKESE